MVAKGEWIRRHALPITLVAAHAVLVWVVFRAALLHPERAGLAPLIAYEPDLPVSIAIVRVTRRFALDYDMRLYVDAASFAVVGSVWWFLVGTVARRAGLFALRRVRRSLTR